MTKKKMELGLEVAEQLLRNVSRGDLTKQPREWRTLYFKWRRDFIEARNSIVFQLPWWKRAQLFFSRRAANDEG